MKNKELSIEEETTRDCPILFRMRYRPMSETCMCWGWECSEGWHETISSACRELEMLNMQYYPKYRVRIQADQIKEKFGTLRFYWTVVRDPNRFYTWLGRLFEKASDKLSKIDYKTEAIIDIPQYDYDEKSEISKEEFDRLSTDKYKPINVEYKEVNGKYIKFYHLHNYGKSHIVPTKHKILWYIEKLCLKLSDKLLWNTSETTSAIRNCISFMNKKAHEIVRKAEQDCESICEFCGSQIGTEWSPTCQTIGYIRYICDRCAKNQDNKYIKNDELWYKDKMIKSKKELSYEKRS